MLPNAKRTQKESPADLSRRSKAKTEGGPPLFNPGLSAGDPPTTKICETNPIPTPRLCETNPICRTTILPAFPCPNMRNKPNLSYRWHLPGSPIPKYAKRTQFTVPLASPRLPHPPLCETNPIYRHRHHLAAQTFTPLCKTNPIYTATDLRKTKNSKRTQS